MLKVWYYFLDQNNGQFKNTFFESFKRLDLHYYPPDWENLPSDPGIIFFNEINTQLFDLLRRFGRNGLVQILAIASSRAVLNGTSSWELLRAGASDVLFRSDQIDPLEVAVKKLQRWAIVSELLNSSQIRDILIGQSPAWVSILRQIIEVIHFTQASILIQGESGTGKELIAHLVHTLDQRPKKRELVIVDCTTIVPELSGSEFFGHERGAFTGAITTREGAFALANGGTLFLDEVGELPLNLQAQLLRVIQEHTYKRVGGNTWYSTEFRLVCATNRDLLQMVSRGEFRHDLYHRIANWVCKLPPLQQRVEDIIPLAYHFMKQLRPDGNLPELEESVRGYLLERQYPGNVRDLKQLISRIMYRHIGYGPITIGDIPEGERPALNDEQIDWHDDSFDHNIRRALIKGLTLKEIGRIAEETAEYMVISEENGNLQRAASRLGLSDRALQLRRAARRQATV